MTATVMIHGSFTSEVSLDITAPGVGVTLIDVTSEALDSLSEAITAARKALPAAVSVS